jgi:DNA-binding response OmpR family regulator
VLTVGDDPIVRVDLRVVLENAGFEVSDARDGIEAGAVTCLRKPFVVDELVRTVAGTLLDRRLAAEREESRRARACILELLGYPEDRAVEEAAFRKGKLWRL